MDLDGMIVTVDDGKISGIECSDEILGQDEDYEEVDTKNITSFVVGEGNTTTAEENDDHEYILGSRICEARDHLASDSKVIVRNEMWRPNGEDDDPGDPGFTADHQHQAKGFSGWNEDMIHDFLAECYTRVKHFKDPNYKKNLLYSDIASALLSRGHYVTTNDVSRKWRNLKSRFHRVHLQKKYTGVVRWAYYADMLEILSIMNDPVLRIPLQSIPKPGMSSQALPKDNTYQLSNIQSMINLDRELMKYLSKSSKDIESPLLDLGDLSSNDDDVEDCSRSSNPTKSMTTLHKHRFSKRKQLMRKIREKKAASFKLKMERNTYLKNIAENMKMANEETKKRSQVLERLISIVSSEIAQKSDSDK